MKELTNEQNQIITDFAYENLKVLLARKDFQNKLDQIDLMIMERPGETYRFRVNPLAEGTQRVCLNWHNSENAIWGLVNRAEILSLIPSYPITDNFEYPAADRHIQSILLWFWDHGWEEIVYPKAMLIADPWGFFIIDKHCHFIYD